MLAQWSLDNHGLRKSVTLTALVNALGAWLRFAATFISSDAHTRLIIVFVGQGLAALAQPVILDSPTLLVANWFGPGERATANTIASVSNPLGIALGSLIAPLMVSGGGDGSDLPRMLMVMAVPPSVAFVLSLVFLRDTPPTAPSHSASHAADSFLAGLKKLRRNAPYWLLCVRPAARRRGGFGFPGQGR